MITLQNISQRFDLDEKAWVFKNVSFTVPAGQSAALIGPSGGGKSVLLKIIAGLIAPTEGRVTLGSAEIGMLFQKNALFDSLTVEENLLFPLREKKNQQGSQARTLAHRMLDAVGLLSSAKLYPSEISGGMQKRLGIARALVVKPEILLYDEPTAGLDPITSRTIAELILKLQRENKTTLLTVTNEMSRAYQLGRRIYLLARQKLVDGGTPDELRATTHPELRQFVYGLKDGPLATATR